MEISFKFSYEQLQEILLEHILEEYGISLHPEQCSFSLKFLAVILILALAAVFVFAPFAIIWALNTLFGLGIAYTFWTWLAVGVLNLTWAGGISAAYAKK